MFTGPPFRPSRHPVHSRQRPADLPRIDGNLWFTDWGSVGRITPTGVSTCFSDPAIGTGEMWITNGPDDQIWFTNDGIGIAGDVRSSTSPPATPFYDEITWLADTGITTGYPDGTFRPTSTVQRMAMAAFLYRFADL